MVIQDVARMYMEYYLTIKNAFAETWMDLKAVILSEVSQIEKDKSRMIELICGRKKKYK